MMLTISEVVEFLKGKYTDIQFFNGCISKSDKCVGVFARGNASPIVAVGYKSSYNNLPVTLLIHWGENSKECEATANKLYEALESGITAINNTRIIQVKMLDSSPVNIGRDDDNTCEMTIRLNILYDRR